MINHWQDINSKYT